MNKQAQTRIAAALKQGPINTAALARALGQDPKNARAKLRRAGVKRPKEIKTLAEASKLAKALVN